MARITNLKGEEIATMLLSWLSINAWLLALLLETAGGGLDLNLTWRRAYYTSCGFLLLNGFFALKVMSWVLEHVGEPGHGERPMRLFAPYAIRRFLGRLCLTLAITLVLWPVLRYVLDVKIVVALLLAFGLGTIIAYFITLKNESFRGWRGSSGQ